jgi:GNAT superfamily N-acetyltransferase
MVVADEIEQLYVSAPHRSQGVAEMLLAEGERAIKDGGHSGAWSHQGRVMLSLPACDR